MKPNLEPVDRLRYYALYFGLMAYAHALNLSIAFDAAIDDEDDALRMLDQVEVETDLETLRSLLRDELLDRLLGFLERHEEAVLSGLARQEDIDRFHDIVDGYDDAVARSSRVLVLLLDRKRGLVEDVTDALAQRGIAMVSAMSKRDLADRIRDRKLRRKWLRTPEGLAYLRERRRRERSHHHVDAVRSRTAKQAHNLYKQ